MSKWELNLNYLEDLEENSPNLSLYWSFVHLEVLRWWASGDPPRDLWLSEPDSDEPEEPDLVAPPGQEAELIFFDRVFLI